MQGTWMSWAYFLSEWAIRVVMLIIVPFRRSSETTKGWLLLIFFQPWIGLAVYLLIGRSRLPPWRYDRVAALRERFAPVTERLALSPNVFHPPVARSLAAGGSARRKSRGAADPRGQPRRAHFRLRRRHRASGGRYRCGAVIMCTCFTTSSPTTRRPPRSSTPSPGRRPAASPAGC